MRLKFLSFSIPLSTIFDMFSQLRMSMVEHHIMSKHVLEQEQRRLMNEKHVLDQQQMRLVAENESLRQELSKVKAQLFFCLIDQQKRIMSSLLEPKDAIAIRACNKYSYRALTKFAILTAKKSEQPRQPPKAASMFMYFWACSYGSNRGFRLSVPFRGFTHREAIAARKKGRYPKVKNLLKKKPAGKNSDC